MRRAASALGTAALLVAASGAAQTIQDADYEKGHSEWQVEHYPAAASSLRTFRAKPYGERFEVDYWIGTSWCRMAGEEANGWDLLSWATYAYPLSPETRTVFESEQHLCRRIVEAQASPAKPTVVVVTISGSGATARAEQT